MEIEISEEDDVQEDEDYPKLQLKLIMLMEFGEKLSFCAIRSILAIYLRNYLRLGERQATIFYHFFIMFSYITPIFGAIIADSYWGRFKLLLIPGLLMVAIGTGGLKPCIAIFGGDQFSTISQKRKFYNHYISLYFWLVNLGTLFGMLVVPLLRNLRAFNEDLCYMYSFALPSLVITLSVILFKTGEPLFVKPELDREVVVFGFFTCFFQAIGEKIRNPLEKSSKFLKIPPHRYTSKQIKDMNAVLGILVIYIPLPVFWCLNVQQASTWTFQASRTDNHLLGYYLAPDEIQILNPILVLLCVPILDSIVYPVFGNKLELLASPLHRMTAGGFTSSKSFFLASLLETKLRRSNPSPPKHNISFVNFMNLLPCAIQILNPSNSVQVLPPYTNFLFNKIPVNNVTNYTVDILSPYQCGDISFQNPHLRLPIEVHERNASSVFIFEDEQLIVSAKTVFDDLEKSLYGRSRVRFIILETKDVLGKTELNVTTKETKSVLIYNYTSNPQTRISVSNFKELTRGNYSYTLRKTNLDNNQSLSELVTDDFSVEVGGVYSLVIQRNKTDITYHKLTLMTPPNKVSLIWMLPQYGFLSVGEALLAESAISFSIAQAPKSMKSVTLAMWYLSIALGNLIVIIITEVKPFRSQKAEFLFYTILAVCTMTLFMAIIARYDLEPEKPTAPKIATSYLAVDGTPLVFGESLNE
ncbi:peptide transporter 3 isoform X2 [Nilaparvata lugens]|uniref:peptide transporter 3 isoform X2 n=1 Tax=Nilaparvata lugens TaxID=108931 RepID=UPI00193EBE2E|nr:peptide transporter 3 isoform X2 [Nilaparvata lugens]